MRLILAYVAAAGVGAVGALILGEYPFKGLVVLGSGVVLGLFVGEAAIAFTRNPDLRLGIGCGVLAAGAMTWAAWISTGHDLSFLGPAGWTSIPLAGVAAFLRTGVSLSVLSVSRTARSRRGSGTPVEAPAPPASREDPPA